MPRLSVITAVRNGAATITACLDSVVAQDIEVEHVVVDGASTDGTVDILRSRTQRPPVWSSAPDDGISDAFNRGIARASGDALLILGADDRLAPGAARLIVAALDANQQAAFAYGHCLHREAGGRMWLNRADRRYRERMRYYMPDVNHASMAVRREAYARIGGYEQRWRYAMDYDWLMRAERADLYGCLIDAVIAERDMGGVSDRRWIGAYAEAREIAILYGAPWGAAWSDHGIRVAKGMVRRGLAGMGCKRLVFWVRSQRQRWLLDR